MTVQEIRARLADYRPERIEEDTVARAAVAIVLCEAPAGVELLLIQRATRDDDPWSGHMAFPGGRRAPSDRDAIATAMRETHEEVGVDLAAFGAPIGHLDELRAIARHRPLDLVISPIVFALDVPVPVTVAPREVQSAIWVPLAHFVSAAARTTYLRSLDGIESEFPAFRYDRYTIWGLTHRILEGFLSVIGWTSTSGGA